MDTWQPAYIQTHTTKRFADKKAGVYLIRDKHTFDIVYIGMSQTNIYDALYRHFQKWSDVVQRVVFQDRENYEVRVIICETPQQAVITERRLIKRLNPSENHEFYEDWEYKPESEPCPY
jgi:excinuclease UvrABC nuclease subunit